MPVWRTLLAEGGGASGELFVLAGCDLRIVRSVRRCEGGVEIVGESEQKVFRERRRVRPAGEQVGEAGVDR